jgi:cyclopropane-fatty-acyl-phospholipid synthase
MHLPRVDVRVESWEDHSPAELYDAIVSIAATAHFLTPEDSETQRIAVLRRFFSRCHEWLKSGGFFSLESIVYGTGKYIAQSPLSGVFPESDMPRLHELSAGFDGLFEPEEIVNHRVHYPPTLRCWLENLTRNRDEAVRLAGEEVVEAYERYLAAGARGHESGVFLLLRYTLKKL